MLKFRKGAYANVVATLALLLAMGGTSYATVIITSANIKNGTIQPIDMAGSATTVGRSFYHDAGKTIQNQVSGKDPVVMTVTVPTGSYAINASTELGNDGGSPVLARCTLNAGADKDVKHIALNSDGAGDTQTAALQVVHTFASAGSITLRCYTFGLSAQAFNTKITAIKLMKLVNTAS